MKRLLLVLVLFIISEQVFAQINAKMMRYMDVSDSHITFVYGGDIWIVNKDGGTASQLTSSLGEESWPQYSPDGDYIAYTASYNGNQDVYVIPAMGGVPTRVTYASYPDRMVAWHPDGERLLIASRRTMGQRSANQLFMVHRDGGMPEALPLPYGELASFSPDGSQLAYITKITENYPFKRYKGGLASDILIYNMDENRVENITENEYNDGKPAWAGNIVYFLSDQGPEFRLNIWMHDTTTGMQRQITRYDEFDISYLSAGPDELVFEMGGGLYLMDLESRNVRQVNVDVVSDKSLEIPRRTDVSRSIARMTAAPGGKRIVFEARGELFNVPASDGYTSNLTRSSGAFDHNPAWSPDGTTLAYWSDKDGEYEIYLHNMTDGSEPQKLSDRGEGYGYSLNWSPDSEKLAFIDETNTIYVIDAENGRVREAGHTNWNIGHNGRYGYVLSWSPDSKWLAFTRGLENAQYAVMLYDTEENELHQATTGFYSDSSPVFSADGNYLFYASNREFSSVYSDMDNTWVYPNSTQLVTVSLTGDIPSLLPPKNDVVEVTGGEEEAGENGNGNGDDEEEMSVSIDFDGFESRITEIPVPAGNIGNLMAFDGKLVYLRYPNSGSGGGSPSLMAFDFEKREQITIMESVNRAQPTADGKAILVQSNGRFGVIQPQPGQNIDTPVSTDGLVMQLEVRKEWEQIFHDTWRRYRDFFYDPEMQQVDWDEMRERYGALLPDARTRWDISNIQSNMLSELSAGHTYTRGGDTESIDFISTGYLGIDWELDDNMYRIGRIVRPADWDTQVRSPFDRPGVSVNEGDYIHSVNGIELDPNQDPYMAFEGLDGKTVSLMISENGRIDDAREVVVTTLSLGQESNLRYLEWIENNRKMVDELSDGRLGYIYMSNTSGQGQQELVRMYYGQLHKQGFIIDERFNGGGQLADRFLELLTRPVVYNLHWRHGRDHTQPVHTNTGPMGMLINGWAGSGGDGLPWAFQELEAGPIVGERTLGILVGPATGHSLIDGGGITVPGARLYDNDGHWFWEGEGVRPDIPVWDDPNMLMQGRDPQMERVVQEVLRNLEANPPRMTPAPPYEDRTARGLRRNRN
ncbi:S41 family peptidase [Rhodohalobacter mucosus]|uniref:Tricorn protease homolog n=1 Tax=Rhodohalobacter mucosus TaxID=2079485 RepID=A0A316TW36_9BACT|nr:S41 family peptidase [Rhodohalobacter mucosus]PWN06762.1 Tricorn protease like protein [Rhodohalobacter mucosus]